MASVLMIGGLSLFAVVTAVITSTFVARAQAETRSDAEDPVAIRLAEIETRLAEIATDVERLASRGEDRPGDGH
jgi:hypothetical protein